MELTIPSFSSAEERDRRYGGFTAAGHPLREGMQCLVSGRLCVWRDGGWHYWRYV